MNQKKSKTRGNTPIKHPSKSKITPPPPPFFFFSLVRPKKKRLSGIAMNYPYKSIIFALSLWIVGCTISLPIFDSAEEVFRRHGILDIYATNIIISNGNFMLIKQDDFDTNGNYSNKLIVDILPHDHKEKNIFWESSHTNALQIYPDGTLLTSSNLTGTFTVSIKVRTFSNSIDIIVANPTTNLSIDTNDFAVPTNETGTLTATLSPSNHTDVVYWHSSDTNVIVINPSNGGYTPSSLGVATITAIAVNREGTTNASNNITIGVIPPAKITNQTFSINENTSNGTIVGTVDANVGITNYAIIAGNTSNAFAINPTNGELTTATTNLDYETISNYALVVEVNDALGNTTNATITVNINNLDEASPTITNQSISVSKNTLPGNVIGTVNASDDIAVTSFAITAGNTSNSFAISNNGSLILASNISNSSITNYGLTVWALDAVGNSNNATITINVTGIDTTPPTITNHSFTVAETVAINTAVGTVNATDNVGVTTYAITAGNSNTAFAINNSGQLTTATNLDYGTLSNYSLTVEVSDAKNHTASNTITITLIDILEWQTRYITNTRTNDLTTAETAALNQTTPIDGLKSKMFAWLDVSISLSLTLNTNGKLTNWVNKKEYTINTNARFSPTSSITTNTNSTNEIIGGEMVAFTNIVTISNVTLSLALSSTISTTPKSDVAGNNSLSLSNGGTNGYVIIDYEGSDRVGLAIDTTPMGSSDNITAFYLVTEWIQGNNSWHVPLGYNNLAEGDRFISKGNANANYEPGGTRGVSNIVLGDSTFERNANFPIPSGIHLLSRRGLSVSKSSLNGILGSFPTTTLGGNQRFRELIIFTNTLNDTEHSNIIKYLHDKWSIPLQGIITNISSYYSASGGNRLQNVIDGDIATYFQGDGAAQNGFVSNRVLFEYQIYGSVLYSALAIGLSTGTNSLYLRTGYSLNNDALKAPFRVEVLRTNDNSWFVLSNVPIDNTSGDKQFIFPLGDASNDFRGYRLLANGNVSSGNWYTIDEFEPSGVSPGDPLVTAFSNAVANSDIYQTNEDIFLTGFTNYLYFDQDVYGLTTNDFVIENATILSFSAINASNYLLIVRPSPFYGGSNTNTNTVIQSPRLRISLSEGAVTNASGNESPSTVLLLNFIPRNPFAGLDVGGYSTPSFVDLDGDGDDDIVSGEADGTFRFYSNDGSNNFTLQTGGNSPLDGFDVGFSSTSSFVDLDGDGDLDLVSGEADGVFNFYRNDGSNFTEVTGGNNPLDGFYAGFYSAPSFVDLDGDGNLDLISGAIAGTFRFYSNDGSNNFTLQTGGNNPLDGFDVGDNSTPSFVDLDGDGDLDLVSGATTGTFIFYRNDGSNFTLQTGGNNPLDGFDVGGNSTPSFVDLDGDGDADLVSGESGGTFIFYMNIGGQFTEGE